MPEFNKGFVPFSEYELGNDINVYGWNTISAVRQSKPGEVTVTAVKTGKVYSAYCPVIDTRINRDGIIKGVWNALSAKGIGGGNMDYRGESTPSEVTGKEASEGTCYKMTCSGYISQSASEVGDLKVSTNEMVMYTEKGWISLASQSKCNCGLSKDILTQTTVGGVPQGTLLASGTPVTDVFEDIFKKFSVPDVKLSLQVNGKSDVSYVDRTSQDWPLSGLLLNVALTSGTKKPQKATVTVSGTLSDQYIYDYPATTAEFRPMCTYNLSGSIMPNLGKTNVFSGYITDGLIESTSKVELDIVYPLFHGISDTKTITEYSQIAPDASKLRYSKPVMYRSQSLSLQFSPDMTVGPHIYFCIPEEFGEVTKITDSNNFEYYLDERDFKVTSVDFVIGASTVKYNVYVNQNENCNTFLFNFALKKKD